MGAIVRFMRSSIGAKVVMAVSGALLVLFLFFHMLGNLQVFIGQDAMNEYGVLLRKLPEFLWAARAGLLVLLVLHVASAIRVTALNRAARPDRYAVNKTQRASLAARTLMPTGMAIFAYVVYHLLHFTLRSVNTRWSHEVDAQGRHDIFTMVVGSFQNPWIAGVYVVAMLLLWSHLSHGIGSFLQTLGLGHPRYHTSVRWLSGALAAVIVLGFISVPVAALAGWVHLPTGGR